YDYGSLFSDCPCYTVKLDPAEPLPAVTNCQWRGHAEQRQEHFLILIFIFSHLRDNLTSVQINADAEPSHCTVEVQTDYRESETQTDPYSPEYVLPPGRTPPELLLKLASLTWGQGLPAGLAEVQMIERMRAKLAWEATLPPLSDLSQLDQRRRMMEKMEAEEWAFRDAEIQELHDARLAARKDLLKQRDEAQKDVTTKRLNLIYSAHQDNIENQKKKIQNDYMRGMKITTPPSGDEEKELAVIYLQKLLRGRCIQYEMAKGKKNHQDLIQEQRAIYALQNDEHQLQKAEDECVKKEIRHKMCQEEARRAGAVGAELHQLFDTLSKELIRLQEERRIHAFMLLAERDRRLREAEESGRRQVEERRRREEDEIFKHVVQVHQESVDLYLEDIILAALGEKADQQAREEIHRRAKEVNDIAYAMEESRDSLHSEEIVSELIYSFLIPEVERINVQQKVHRKQLKHLQAARAILYGAAQPSGKVHDAESATCVTPESFPQHQLERLSQEEQENEAASPT
uniref:Cilia- and flagella-associated protein 91 n=1 Tax=Gouania willdenowi TaxID=441366 RepID=A0A8C5HI62_GOUWI